MKTQFANVRAEFQNANAELQKAVADLQRQRPGLGYTGAWNTVMAERKDVYLAMCHAGAVVRAGERARLRLPQFTNAVPPALAETSLSKSQREDLFGLHGCTDEEMDAAWQCNNVCARPINYNRIFSGLVNRVMGEKKCSRLDAVRNIQARFPEFFGKVTGADHVPATEPGAEMANSVPEPPAFAVVPPQYFAPLGLAPGVKPEIFREAWVANGGQLASRNTSAIVAAIVKYLQKETGVTALTAMAFIQKNFPVLASEMKAPEIDMSGIQQ